MKKCQVVLMLIPLLLITGCSVNYEIEILDDKKYAVTEEFEIIDGTVEYGYNLTELVKNIQNRNGAFYNFYELEDAGDYCIDSEEENCDPNKVSVPYGIGAQKKYINLTDLTSSKAITEYFGTLNITSSGTKYKIIGTPSSKLGAIIQDVNLFKGIISSLKVSIKVPYTVLNHNADSVSNNNYVWEFNSSNYNSKQINLEWTTNSSSTPTTKVNQSDIISNSQNSSFNFLYIGIGVAIIGIGVMIYLLIKNRNNNKV